VRHYKKLSLEIDIFFYFIIGVFVRSNTTGRTESFVIGGNERQSKVQGLLIQHYVLTEIIFSTCLRVYENSTLNH
jgi:hypothetical protein